MLVGMYLILPMKKQTMRIDKLALLKSIKNLDLFQGRGFLLLYSAKAYQMGDYIDRREVTASLLEGLIPS